MARTAEPLATWEVNPDELPDGISVAQTSRTVGDRPDRPEGMSDEDYEALCAADPNYRKGALIRVLRVAHTGEAVRNAIAFLSEHGPGEDYGIRFAAEAINGALLNHVGKLNADQVDSALSFVPPISGPRYVDPYEAVGAQVQEIFRRGALEGTSPKDIQKQVAELYASLTA